MISFLRELKLRVDIHRTRNALISGILQVRTVEEGAYKVNSKMSAVFVKIRGTRGEYLVKFYGDQGWRYVDLKLYDQYNNRDIFRWVDDRIRYGNSN